MPSWWHWKKVEFLIGSPVVFFFSWTSSSDSGFQMFVIPSITFFFVEYALEDRWVTEQFFTTFWSQARIFHWIGETKKCVKMKLTYHKVISMYICVLCGIELIIAWIPKNNGAWPSSAKKFFSFITELSILLKACSIIDFILMMEKLWSFLTSYILVACT